eukprot:scaffold36084_cov101-Isochrysis_galbana.AAC.1
MPPGRSPAVCEEGLFELFGTAPLECGPPRLLVPVLAVAAPLHWVLRQHQHGGALVGEPGVHRLVPCVGVAGRLRLRAKGALVERAEIPKHADVAEALR